MDIRSLQHLEERIRQEIPITRHLDFSFELEDGTLITRAPLSANINHAGTAFGGSVSMLFTLTGWARTYMVVQELGLDAEIVVQDIYIDYGIPVHGDIRIMCPEPGEIASRRVHFMLTRWGKARLSVWGSIQDKGKDLVTFKGRYVALAE